MNSKMPKFNKAYKFRIYPNKSQEQLIAQTFGNCRYVYNHYLNERIDLYKESKTTLNYYDNANNLKFLKNEFEWLKLTDSTAYQNSLKDLQAAYSNFFKTKSGFPKLKNKHDERQSYRSTNVNNSIKIIDNKYIQVPRLGMVRCKFSRKVEGKILSATISKNPSGKYFISLCCKNVTIEPFEKTNSVIGIDLGIKDFAITSNGEKFENPKYLTKSEKRLAKLQRELSRKSKDSNNRNKARIKVAKCYEKISNQRTDYLQKLSTKIIRENDVICLETLGVKNMIKNHKLAKSISDVSWSTFVNQLEYKANWYDKKVVRIDRFFASSQTCHNCGTKSPITKDLSVREWICPNCNTKLDRDINAAINILNEGLKTN